MILFGDNFGKETINTEFKEFSIYDDLSEKMIKNMIKSKLINKYILNEFIECINKNLKLNLIKYIPKYIASFSNSNINGTLYLGIGNDGKYYGIPHINLTSNMIKDLLIECKNYIDIDFDIENNISIDIIQINKSNIEKTYNSSKLLLQQSINKYIFELSKFNDYSNKRNRHIKKINKYRCKIGMVITNQQLKKECIQFVKQKCNDENIINKII